MVEAPSLAAAAEALVKAACANVQETSLSLSKENAASLKQIDASLKALTEAVKSSHSSTADCSSKTIQAINEASTNTLKAINESSKQARLEWADEHASNGSFRFVDGYKNQQTESKEFVQTIISNFKRGFGSHIDNRYIDRNDEKGREQFQTKLVEQIHALTGNKPRETVEKNGLAAIFYS